MRKQVNFQLTMLSTPLFSMTQIFKCSKKIHKNFVFFHFFTQRPATIIWLNRKWNLFKWFFFCFISLVPSLFILLYIFWTQVMKLKFNSLSNEFNGFGFSYLGDFGPWELLPFITNFWHAFKRLLPKFFCIWERISA